MRYIFQVVVPTTPLLHIWLYLLKNLVLGMILVLYNKTPCSFWGAVPPDPLFQRSPQNSDPLSNPRSAPA